MRLKKRQRVDAIRNDVRAPAKQWGKWLYLALVASFVFWLFDLFLGEMFYFRADGLVVRDRVVLATQYDASVVTLDVQEGEAVAGDTAVAMLRSQAVEQTIAELSARIATMLEQASRLEVRRKVIEATRGLVNGRVEVARSARREVEERAMYFTQRDRMQRLKDELESLQTRSTDEAEYAVIQSDLPKLRSAIENAQSALRRLEETYAGGVVRVPVDGVVGHLHVSQGSVVTKTTPLMEVYAGAPYVLAYVPEGAIYSLAAGDPVTVHVGFSSYDGEVEAIYPVTATLPDEYIDALRVPRRAPLARIRFTGADGLPSLFAQTEVMASGWPPRWFLRLFGATWSDKRPAPETTDLPPVAVAKGAAAGRREPPALHTEIQVRPPLNDSSMNLAGSFVLQLVALPAMESAQAFVRERGLLGARIVPVDAAGQVRYAVFIDGFGDRSEAVLTARRLGAVLDGITPWIRPVRSLEQARLVAESRNLVVAATGG